MFEELYNNKKKSKVKCFKCEKTHKRHKENAGWCLSIEKWRSSIALLPLKVLAEQHDKHARASWELLKPKMTHTKVRTHFVVLHFIAREPFDINPVNKRHIGPFIFCQIKCMPIFEVVPKDA